MLKEIISKSDYNKKLEAVICFILEMIMSKSKMKNNPELKNLFLSNEQNNQFQDKISFGKIPYISNNNNGGILEPFQAFLSKYYERTKNTGFLSNRENNMNNQEIAKYKNLYLDEDKYYYPYNNNIDPNLNAKILKHNLISDKTEDNLYQNNNNKLSNYILTNKRKRSSSFNSILSNISKGSNVVYNNNNNKLLPEDEEQKITNKNLEKIEEKKNDEINDNALNNSLLSRKDSMISRKDSMLSWNDGKNSNAFDLDLNQDENKSYLSGWNKDLLNNSQSSFNDIYNNNDNNNMNKDNAMFSDINN